MPHHGWIQLDDGRICDPTRWVFENVDPYLFVGEDTDEEYDFGNNKLKEMMMTPAPEHNPDSQEFKARLESDIFIVSFNGSKFKVTFTDSQHFRAYESVD